MYINQVDIFNTDRHDESIYQESFIYRAIMTNNTEMYDLETIEFHNNRGDSEQIFDEMNNVVFWKFGCKSPNVG
ncbi:MAG: hypothetical protein PF436_13185 [Prolixibacteraceae bacterium]|jgi:hypothetical protein|nr:hypothetical protein [Prolixibacteraceae bacterium]